MVLEEIIGRVQYPDRKTVAKSALPYNEVVLFLQNGIKNATGQLKTDLQETLAELEHRQKERQQIHFLFEINRHTVNIKAVNIAITGEIG